MPAQQLPKKNKKSKTTLSSQEKTVVQVGDISSVTGTVNIAAGDIVTNIQTIYERLRTPGEILEKELQIEAGELERGVQSYLERLKQQVAGHHTPSPYKGLEAYTLSDVEIFYGRDQAIRDLREAVKRGPLTILQAESGAGKTSLLQAGLIPKLIAEGHLATLVRPQFTNPSDAIKKVFLGNLELTPKLAGTPLVDFLRRVKIIIGNQTTLYLVLDQFEEFFSKQVLEQDRQEFICDLADCINDASLNLRWIISITTDVFGQLGKFEPLVRNPFSNVQSLNLLTRQEAAQIIAKPAEIHGISFEEGLLDRLLNDLGHNNDEPIPPTQIQLVCAALYDEIKDGQASIFTHKHYDQKGGAEQILHGYIENVLQHHLPPGERPAAYKILEALVTSEKKRVIRTKEEIELYLQPQSVPPELLDSTLGHLVNRRLLRRLGDQWETLQYEIVHDYLLKELEINEDVQNAKEADELLHQGVLSWEKRGLLLAPDVLKILEVQALDSQISSTEAALLFLSAVEYHRPADRWGRLISEAERKTIITSLFAEKNSSRKREALWSLRSSLTGQQKARVTLARSSFVVLRLLQKGILIVFIGIAVFILGRIGLDLTLYFVPWTEVTSFHSQCLARERPSDLLVAIDKQDSSHVVVYDPLSRVLCETKNTGARWQVVASRLPADLEINSIVLDSKMYLATEKGLYSQQQDGTWQHFGHSPEAKFNLKEIEVPSDDIHIYAATNQGLLYAFDSTRNTWDEIPLGEITGSIQDITANYDYFAISTEDGIWYRVIGTDNQWKKFNLKLDERVIITSMQMVYPAQRWIDTLFDSKEDDWFLATTETGEIYYGYLTESGGLQEMPSQLPSEAAAAPISSFAVNGYSKFSSRSGKLYCEQSWDILNSEWWLSKFSRQQPCK